MSIIFLRFTPPNFDRCNVNVHGSFFLLRGGSSLIALMPSHHRHFVRENLIEPVSSWSVHYIIQLPKNHQISRTKQIKSSLLTRIERAAFVINDVRSFKYIIGAIPSTRIACRSSVNVKAESVPHLNAKAVSILHHNRTFAGQKPPNRSK